MIYHYYLFLMISSHITTIQVSRESTVKIFYNFRNLNFLGSDLSIPTNVTRSIEVILLLAMLLHCCMLIYRVCQTGRTSKKVHNLVIMEHEEKNVFCIWPFNVNAQELLEVTYN
jgi:hypothetical protein